MGNDGDQAANVRERRAARDRGDNGRRAGGRFAKCDYGWHRGRKLDSMNKRQHSGYGRRSAACDGGRWDGQLRWDGDDGRVGWNALPITGGDGRSACRDSCGRRVSGIGALRPAYDVGWARKDRDGERRTSLRGGMGDWAWEHGSAVVCCSRCVLGRPCRGNLCTDNNHRRCIADDCCCIDDSCGRRNSTAVNSLEDGDCVILWRWLARHWSCRYDGSSSAFGRRACCRHSRCDGDGDFRS